MYPPVTYITDCTDENAKARLANRIAALFGQPPIIIPIGGRAAEISAGLTLLDSLRSTESLGEVGSPTVILLNIAPRDGKWPNGAPYCYFWHGRHLVVSTLNAHVLSLARRYLDIKQVFVTDVRDVVEAAKEWASLSAVETERIVTTQFRSLWYLPLLAKWVIDGQRVPASLEDLPVPKRDDVVVAFVDNFGNCKLNCRGDEIGFSAGSILSILSYDGERIDKVRDVRCYEHLIHVPAGEAGLIVGSSGFDFIELVIRGGSAAANFGLEAGSRVICDPANRAHGRGSAVGPSGLS